MTSHMEGESIPRYRLEPRDNSMKRALRKLKQLPYNLKDLGVRYVMVNDGDYQYSSNYH